MKCVCTHLHGLNGCVLCSCTLFTPDDGNADMGGPERSWLGAWTYYHDPKEEYPFSGSVAER